MAFDRCDIDVELTKWIEARMGYESSAVLKVLVDEEIKNSASTRIEHETALPHPALFLKAHLDPLSSQWLSSRNSGRT